MLSVSLYSGAAERSAGLHTFFQVEQIPQEPIQDTTKRDLRPYEDDRFGDPISNPRSTSPLLLNQVPGADLSIEIDSSGNFYQINEDLKGIDFRPPSVIGFDEYRNYLYRKQQKDYWRDLSIQQDGGNVLPGKDGKRLIPPIYLGQLADRLFGGSTMVFNTSGSVLLDFGGRWQRVDNPQLPVRQQRVGGFNFDQQIGMALEGKIGEKLSISGNFDTKSVFQFDQRYNVSYTAYDHDIIQDIQVGNVSFPVSNSLISGGQNLFGVYSRLRFGNLYINSVFSSQRGSIETLTIRNGAQSKEFEIRADEYENNRHFFLSQFFRDNYERSLQQLPNVNSGAIVTRVKVYVTNRSNDTQSLRSIAAYMDLGEGDPYNPSWGGMPSPTDNDANTLYETLTGNTSARSQDQVKTVSENLGMENGVDFEVLASARELTPSEFQVNAQLGYITLNTPLRNDEVLAVAFEYTYNGQTFKVGELNEDYTNLGANDIIFFKLLSPSTVRTDLPTWDLMMKNIYPLESNQVQKENFQLRIIYRDDDSGVDNPSLHEGENTRNIPLLRLSGLDTLNQNLEYQPDGNFDYIEGVTIQPNNGRVIFPVLEPFGNNLQSYFLPAESNLVDKYVFDTLYTGTQADAKLNTAQNKYFIKGSYQSGGSGEIALPGMMIAENSVVVTVGGVPLTEGTDYTVDYQFSRVRILNEGIMSSGKDIKIQFERADPFNFQTRNLAGVDLEYFVNPDLKLTATLMHLNEKPNIRRVSVGSEPTKNTLWGASIDYRKDSRMLTKMVDALPGISTKATSSVTFKGEIAQLIPSAPKLLGTEGVAYIDDFEQAESAHDLTRSVVQWSLGATPELIKEQLVDNANPQSINYNRAKLAWYNIDNAFYFDGGLNGNGRPEGVTEEMQRNHYARQIPFGEVFQGQEQGQIRVPEVTFDLAYYPSERGQFNYNPDLDQNGHLKNPEDNFGAITKAISHDVDFDNLNIQYIEFWMMDPFMQGENARVEGQNNTTGGKLYINLGNISEDLIPDGRHFFENGLTTNRSDMVENEAFGLTPNTQYLNNAFNNAVPREAQDVGFDGLSSEEERAFFADFINSLPAVLSPDVRDEIINDPSADDFRYYLEYSGTDVDILQRYKRFNGTEGNSPENNDGGSSFAQSSTNQPDNEDLNRDNTLAQLDQYFQYEVDLRPGQLNRSHPFIVDVVESNTQETNNETVRWYQFRIPIRGNHAEAVGGIQSYKSIRFMRMFMTDWEQPVVLRLLNYQLVEAQWRAYEENIDNPEEGTAPTSTIAISTVNIEENGNVEDNGIPYVLPPDFERDYDITSFVTRRINEQSLKVCVEDLPDGESRAVYKNLVADLVNYKRIRMELHAEGDNVSDGEVAAFLRLGTDFVQNYYEIEVPLKITPRGSTAPEAIWPRENEIDISLEELYEIKAQRNRANLPVGEPFTTFVRDYRVTLYGRPDLSSVQTAMIGVRNLQNEFAGADKDICIWANELRVTEYNAFSGWATNATLNANLADLGNVRAGLRYSTVGFGGIQDKVGDRQRNENLSYDISANMNMEKFWLDRVGISLPLFVSYEKSTSNPFFDPLDPDIPLGVALSTFDDELKAESYREKVRDYQDAFSINTSGIRKKKMREGAKSYPWDIENFTFNGAYTRRFMSNQNTASMEDVQWSLGAIYAYQSPLKPIEPFRSSKVLDSPYLALLKDFNFNPLPNSVAINGKLDRRFKRTQLRDRELNEDPQLLYFEKGFLFNRNYNVNWNVAKSLTLDYAATANAIIDEPIGDVDNQAAQDSIWSNLKRFGRLKQFNQNINATYRLPLDKIPVLSFMSADMRYTGGSTWTAGTLGLADSLGNNIQNSQQFSLNGKIDLKRIYDQSNYLKVINQPARGNSRRSKVSPARRRRTRLDADHPLKLKEGRLEKKISRLKKKQGKRKEKAERKQKKKEENIQEKIASRQADSLDTSSLEEELAALQKVSSDTTKLDRKLVKLEEELKALKQEIRALEKEGEQKKSVGRELADGTARFLTMVKDVDGSYSQSNQTIIPGYTPIPKLFGFDENWDAPGADFLLGSQDFGIRDEILPYLARSNSQSTPFQQRRSEEMRFRANVEPFKDFRIALEATRTRNSAYTEILRYIPDTNIFDSQSPQRSGSWGASYFTLLTSFTKVENERSPLFEEFERNREVIQQRLLSENPGVPYGLNDQDVLIPSFVAAYTGKSAEEVDFSPFPEIPIPNWQVTYNGLSKWSVFDGVLQSFSLNHRYSSKYDVGTYSSSLSYGVAQIGMDLSERDAPLASQSQNGAVIPVYVMNQINIDEQFSPLIGVSMKFTNDFQLRMDYKKGRRLSMNLSNAQLAEQNNNDFVIDIGYTKAGMRLPFRSQGRTVILDNDITFRMGLTIRESLTYQRKIAEEDVVTAGTWNFQLKPTINYVLNDRANLQFYFERAVNEPRVSTAFRQANTAFGFQLRYDLTQQ
ncbi:cell surface protein SprA [Algivirga pacifica]|uniref:Cell surface protein SprA n=2 Tax=Algivirga pacifica TaxID=1162670 RepID=A0ABP9CYV2_9BACT